MIYGNGLISLDRFETYRQDKKYTTATSEPMSTRMILLNTTSPILKDLKVRHALSHAVDKQSIAKNIFGGIEKPADTIFAPNVPHTNIELAKYNFDLAKAQALLDEAGWKKGADGMREKDGKKMILSFPYISSKVTDKNVGEYIQGEWKNATAKNYDLMSDYSWGAPWDPHAYLTAMADDSVNGTNPAYAAQLGLPMKAELDKTIRALLIEPDQTKLNEMYKYVLTTLQEQAVYIPISYQALLSVYRTGELEGVKFMPEENRLPVWTTVKVK